MNTGVSNLEVRDKAVSFEKQLFVLLALYGLVLFAPMLAYVN